MKLLIVIPAMNEEKAIGGLLDEIKAACAQATLPAATEVVVIDDGSADRTAQIAHDRGVRVVRLCRNLGIGGAVQTGLRLAQRERFDAAIQVDGDGQHPPSEIARLLEPLKSEIAPDIVVGSRRIEQVGYQSTPPRRMGQAWLRLWLWLVCRLRVTDPTSGFRVYGRRALELFAHTYPYDFPEPEALAMAAAHGLRIVEEPVRMRERQGGRSSIGGLTPIYYMVKVTLAVLLSFIRYRARARARRSLGRTTSPQGGPHATLG
jgi:glycosyltransferase involved in cell wall biosynthesis